MIGAHNTIAAAIGAQGKIVQCRRETVEGAIKQLEFLEHRDLMSTSGSSTIGT